MSSVRSRNSSLPPSAQEGGGSSRRATSASASGGGGGGGSRHSVTSVAAASASARTRASHSARRSFASAGGAGGQQKAPPPSPPPPPPPPPAPAADHSSVDSWETDDTAGGGRAVDTGPACRGSMLPRSSTGYLRDYHADELAVDSCAAAGEENEEEEDQQGRAVVAAAAAEKKVSPEAVAAAAGSIVNEESSGASSIEEEEEEEEEGEGGVLKADDGGDDDNNIKGEDDYNDEDEEQEERGEVEGQQRHPQRKTKKQQKKEDKKNMKKRVPPPPSPAVAATPQSSSSLRLAAPPSPHDSPKTLTLPTTTTAAAAAAPPQHPCGALVCPVTQEPVKVYCHDDGALDCLICPSQDRHRGHRVELLRDFCASQKRVLAADRGACRSLIGNLKELEEDTPLRATRLHTQVDEAIDSVVAALNERRRALHDDIRKRSQILISDLSGELTSRKQQLQHLESATLTLTLLSNGRGVAPEGSIGDLLRGTMTYDEFLAVGDPDMPPAPTIKQLLNVRVPLKMREEILHFDWSAETRDNHPLVYPPKGF